MIKVMVFIDGTWLYSNLRHLAKETGRTSFYVDYGNLPHAIKYQLEKREGLPTMDLVRTFLFGSYPVNHDPTDEDRARRRKDFFSLLREDYYYEVEAYPIDYQGRRILHDDRADEDPFIPREKCVDIALASSMMYHAAINAFDLAIVVIGDKDYYPVLQKVRLMGKRVAIASIRQSCARAYADRSDEKKLKDFHVVWLNDLTDKIAWDPEPVPVECRSPLHEGPREVLTTIRLREGQPFFCDECRSRFSEQKAEQLRQFTGGDDDGYGAPPSFDRASREEEAWVEDDATYYGVIENVKPDRGFGFIRREDGNSYFFHVTHLTNAEWNDVMPGDRVNFTVIKKPVGTKAGSAGTVTVLFEDEARDEEVA